MQSRLTVYKASAGSGKTFTLAIQYIKLLILSPGGQGYRRILAVTFTNKATAEMKERILQQLYGIWQALPSSDGYLSVLRAELRNETDTTLSDEDIRQRAGLALRNILHDYSRFRVETIDSFFQSVLDNLAHELSLTANLQVDLNDKEALSLAVDRIMDRLNIDKTTFDLIADYVDERIRNNERWDVSGEVKSFAEEIFKDAYLKHSEQLNEVLGDNKTMRKLRTDLHFIIDSARDIVESAVTHFEEELAAHDMSYESFSRGSTLRTFLHKLSAGQLSEEPGTVVQSYLNDPQNMLTKANRKDLGLCNEAAYFQGLLTELRHYQLQCAETLYTARLALKNLNPLRLLGKIDEEVTVLNNETNRFLLVKTPILLSRLIEGSDAPFIFEKIGSQFSHIMIDEFQDTSTLQWHNFKTLLLENMAQGASNLLVGDVKQSIYRWRNGDWRILAGIGQTMATFSPDIRQLKYNYRSEKRIVTFNNAFFRQAAACLDALAPDATLKLSDAYADVEQECPGNKAFEGCVNIRFYKDAAGTYADKEWESRMLDDLCDRVRQLHEAGLPYNQMAILLRKRHQALPIISRFAERMPEVSLVSNEAFLLSSSVSVNMLIASLRYLNDPEEMLAAAYVALHYRTDVLGQPFDLHGCVHRKHLQEHLPDALTQHRDELCRLPLYELQERLVDLLQLNRPAGQSAYLLTYFDELSLYLENNPSDIKSFLRYWDETLAFKSIPSGDTDGIRIFTIHKSKGLQFHTVLLPYFTWDIVKDQISNQHKTNLLWCKAPLKSDGTPMAPYGLLPVLPVTLEANMQHSAFASEYEEEHLQMRVDALNMMYVAFTRAEKNLFVWGKTKYELTDTSRIHDLVYAALPLYLNGVETEHETVELSRSKKLDVVSSYTYGTPVVPVPQAADMPVLPFDTPLNRLIPKAEMRSVSMFTAPLPLSFRQSNRSTEFVTQTGEEVQSSADGNRNFYINQGKLLHFIFSTIRTADDIENTLNQFEQEGLIAGTAQRRRLSGWVERGLQRPQVADWFSGNYRLYNECSILSPDPRTGECIVRRPDRVMMSDTDLIVVDFKFGTPKDEYHTQVREYMQLLARMCPDHHVSGYLWYVYINKIEEVSPQ